MTSEIVAAWTIRAIVALVLIASALSKALATTDHFHGDGVIALLRSPAVKYPVILIEIALGSALLTRWWRRAMWGALCWVLALSGAVLTLALLGKDVSDCGCFGTARVPMSSHLFLLAGLVVLSGGGLRLTRPDLVESDRRRSANR